MFVAFRAALKTRTSSIIPSNGEVESVSPTHTATLYAPPQSPVAAEASWTPFTYRRAVVPSNVSATWYHFPPTTVVWDTRLPIASFFASASIFPSVRVQIRQLFGKEALPTSPWLVVKVSRLNQSAAVNDAVFRLEAAGTVTTSSTPSKALATPTFPGTGTGPEIVPGFPFPERSSSRGLASSVVQSMSKYKTSEAGGRSNWDSSVVRPSRSYA